MLKRLRRCARVLVGAVLAACCTGCVSAPDSVREQASSALACDVSRVTVTRTKQRYLRDDAYEAVGCGLKAAYICDRAYVLLIPVGTTACRKSEE